MAASVRRAAFPLRLWWAPTGPATGTDAIRMCPTGIPTSKAIRFWVWASSRNPATTWIPTRSCCLAGTYGNVARGALRGPGFFNVNTSFFKRIPLKERLNAQFRVEAFNVLNHANFRYPELIIFAGNDFAGSAGVIPVTANRERQIQFALRFEF